MMRLSLATALVAACAQAKMGNMYKSVTQTEDDRVRNIKAKIATEGKLNPQEFYYDATIDHFTNHGDDAPTY